MKRHGCLVTYLLYTAIYYIYFILIGKFLSSLSLGIQSDDLLAFTLLMSSLLALATAILVMNWKRILSLLKLK
ncbi:MAG TPA: hypothetical protein VFQ23_11875 [Anaerolineales bacterium]|nr:hypothetical protein [Anaerolineales bacterium]